MIQTNPHTLMCCLAVLAIHLALSHRLILVNKHGKRSYNAKENEKTASHNSVGDNDKHDVHCATVNFEGATG